MAAFQGSTYNKAPLTLQLSTTTSGAGSVAFLVGIRASGAQDSGSASRPVLSRPSTLGVGSSLITPRPLGPGNSSASCTLADGFSTAPSLPSAAETASSLPIVVQWDADLANAIVVGGQGVSAGLLLYARASGGHTWVGELIWEEPL